MFGVETVGLRFNKYLLLVLTFAIFNFIQLEVTQDLRRKVRRRMSAVTKVIAQRFYGEVLFFKMTLEYIETHKQL